MTVHLLSRGSALTYAHMLFAISHVLPHSRSVETRSLQTRPRCLIAPATQFLRAPPRRSLERRVVRRNGRHPRLSRHLSRLQTRRRLESGGGPSAGRRRNCATSGAGHVYAQLLPLTAVAPFTANRLLVGWLQGVLASMPQQGEGGQLAVICGAKPWHS
eukprot:355908-Chlamydomonas_euryale.AAC.4